MEVDLYQRRGGFAGLGVCGDGTDPIADLTCGATTSITPTVASSVLPGIDINSMSPTTLLLMGGFGLWMLNAVFSGSKRAYGSVARPLKKRRKTQKKLAEAKDRYDQERKRLGGGGFF